MTQWLALLVIAATPPAGPPDDPRARGYLGISVSTQDLNSLIVFETKPGTPAERGGVQPGDKLVRVGRIAPRTFEEMRDHIESFRPGTALRFELLRPDPNGGPAATLVVTVRLMALPPEVAAVRSPPE